ncbi:MAG: O-acetylhomoserine aminocarboxypropyltransferase/cysteine synthase [Sutterellaceae bacterium]|nr:O-acetylhomoserine aminocarboxypropyltransferase/cysteine synthase [Burkholderiaceae bacterium]MCX7902028.1 O-acetylhomoserine aminocarboxypropyltransferase/cysteine synthase [Burkholderiaceae bacterium]MDW8430546.1 O-acetylhomoserine aminocarboxypropyltransferase/cysteine synthase [Sutterellaceae bacterium]
MDRQFGIETLCLHAGQLPDPVTGSRAQPIYQTTSYVFDSADHAASLFNLQTFGNVYSRISNPTVAVFEERMAALENGRAALATASGMAAQMTAILAIVQPGQHIVASSLLYGGTYSQLAVTLPKMGIETTFVDPDDPQNFRRALRPNTRLIYGETLGNPKINVLDIEAIAAIAHEAGIPLAVDNTMASPYLCRPIEWGADIVLHSATKFIGGHGTTLGGVIVESGRFDWGNGNFPDMVLPSKGYHGVKFWETFGDFAFTMKARFEVLRVHGAALAPISAWLLLQGLETLHVRMERHVQNARRVAEFLAAHPRVAWVNWPGLKTSPYYSLAKKYLRAIDGEPGASSVMTFGIKGGAAAGEKFIDNLQFLSHLANIGDAKSLVIHPASTTHRQLSEEEQRAAGVLPEMVRLSIGIESIEDILWDLEQALARSG